MASLLASTISQKKQTKQGKQANALIAVEHVFARRPFEDSKGGADDAAPPHFESANTTNKGD
jgi:hypothetical protein